MKKRGISLIVLIVTIIVIIILAAVVILTITKNNPIESSKEATFKEDIRTFQDELAMYISKDYTNKAGQRDYKITATNYNPAGDPESVYTYIPSFSKKYEGKFVIKNDELMYNEDMIQQEKDWCNSINVKENIKTGAEKAKDDPQNYYGAKVNYKTGNEDIDKDITEWKIFYSDGSNVYIISSNYVDPSNLPQKNGAKPYHQENNETYPKAACFNNLILAKYKGSESVTDDRIKALNRDYFKERINEETGEKYVFSSGDNANMKSAAYILDIDIWKVFANESVAEYAIGGPSAEILLKSYSEKKNVDYRAKASSATGYVISNDGGTSWAGEISGLISTNDRLYVLPQNTGAGAMWLASPSAMYRDRGMVLSYVGYVGGIPIGNFSVGFRPIVCLNSNIMLNEVEGGYEISQ